MSDIANDCVCGGRGYVDDDHEPRERYCICPAADRLRMSDAHPHPPPRTVYVNPVTYFAIAKRHGVEPIADVTVSMTDGMAIDGWHVVSDPDCPFNYWWPATESARVDAVIGESIKSTPHVVPNRPLVRIRYEDGTEDVAEYIETHPPRQGIARIE